MEDWPETIEDTLIDIRIGNETTNCTWTKGRDPRWRERMAWKRIENCRVMKMPPTPWADGANWRERRAWKRANR
jgi:hypothetical protein